MPESRVVLNDPALRRALWRWLASTLDPSKPTVVLNEVPLQCGSAVIDVAVANGELVGYEIKSDVDSLRRLTQQIDLYGEVFDRLYAVTTPRRSRAVDAAIPRWWGLIVLDERLEIVEHRPAQKNRGVVVEAVLDLLTRVELAVIARGSGMRRYAGDAKHVLCERIHGELGVEGAKDAVRRRLRERPDWTARQRGLEGELRFG